jgi:hypothetical protein
MYMPVFLSGELWLRKAPREGIAGLIIESKPQKEETVFRHPLVKSMR